MGKRRFTDKQGLEVLAKHDAGASVADLYCKHQISPATFDKWKRDKVTNRDEQLWRLKELEAKISGLRKCMPI